MEVFRDLYLHGDREQVAAVIAEVERSLTGGWTRDSVAEEGMRSLMAGSVTYCFFCTREAGRPGARVFLAEKEAVLFYVSNVVPYQQHQLSYREYNAILEEFCERFLLPHAERAGLRVELTATQADLSNWLSPPVAERLRKFSLCANKSTGSSHPSDRERWNDFVVAAHRDHSSLDAYTLRRWLIEVEGWPPEVAARLALEYEYGRELLAFSEGRRSA
jgi:hypothetical protein